MGKGEGSAGGFEKNEAFQKYLGVKISSTEREL